MLLHHYGIAASEGELAYLSNTSLLGVTAIAMADALAIKLEGTNLRPVVERRTYDELCSATEPFVAQVDLPRLGGHTLFVISCSAEKAVVVDPGKGVHDVMSRGDFESIWDGTVLRLVSR
jgi:hypothetical protein